MIETVDTWPAGSAGCAMCTDAIQTRRIRPVAISVEPRWSCAACWRSQRGSATSTAVELDDPGARSIAITYSAAREGDVATHRAKDPHAVAAATSRMLPPRSDREARRVLVCLCDPIRFKIVRALQATELAAGDIAIVIERSRATTSHHLRIL